ncbi:MAG: hypothetical protein H6620_10495 [Halobacteriovoraceae bacterium]|nr:hypothetical protein [Halobacteriovoraceae bacterium]
MDTAGIKIEKKWSDEHVIQFEVSVSDGYSIFRNKVYVGNDRIIEIVNDLNDFREQVYGGLYDLNIGGFGREYAQGALSIRFHFKTPGRLYIKVKAESEFDRFHSEEIASKVFLFFTAEISSLDNFVKELTSLSNGNRELACLHGIDWSWS